ncbi:Fic family protein [Thalassomonas actiniarum]|uniref:Fic family protein n=1 Tax=Thalassomonas actiniarum TaxID=485447 RepID=A0AAE9YUG0_9GAMM|nr:Fic family protein [Thalassomonas actiniarum]WDD99851.1 Fic family protein [Thalassomonas actiniarum]
MASYETQMWQANQQPYQAYVPDAIADKEYFTSLRLQTALNQLNESAIAKVHQGFFTRYLAGSVSLREGAKVSHKQLALCSVGIPNTEPLVQDLWSQMNYFQRGSIFARSFFNGVQSWEKNSLLALHSVLAPEVKNKGRFRLSSCWIGAKTPTKARFVAPEPTRLEELMEEWLAYIRLHTPLSLEQILIAYDQFLVIHPFSDGNGRVSRVFMDATLSHLRTGYWLHPLFFRLANSSKCYINAHNAYQRDEIDSWLNYWEDAFEWLVMKQQLIAQALEACEQAFKRTLVCTAIPKGWSELVRQLYSTPIITMEIAHRYLDAATLMLQLGLLKVKQVAFMGNATVLECPQIFKLWQQWEDILLRH